MRRYCHQFEQQLPLVEPGRYKINLDIYREKQNATNSEGSSVEISSQSRPNERVRDTQELFEEYCRQRRKQQELEKQKKEKEHQKQLKLQKEQKLQEQQEQQKQQKELELNTICDVDDEVAFINETPPPPVVQNKRVNNSRDNSDEAIVMSPLLLVSDSEDVDDVPQICNDPNDDTDIVDLSSEEEMGQNENTKESERNDIVLATDEETMGNLETGKSVEILETEEELVEIEETERSLGGATDIDATEKNEQRIDRERTPEKEKVKKKRHKTNELEQLKADVATNLKFQNETTPKRRTRHVDENQCQVNSKRGTNDEVRRTTTKGAEYYNTDDDARKTCVSEDNNLLNSSINKDNKNRTPTNVREEIEIEKDTSNDKRQRNKKSTEISHKDKAQKFQEIDRKNEDKSTPQPSRSNKKSVVHDAEKACTTPTPSTRRSRKSPADRNNSPSEANKTSTTPVLDVVIKKEPEDHSPSTTKRPLSKEINTTIQRIKRELDVDRVVIHKIGTRSAQRSTRSAGSSSKPNPKNALFSNDKPTKTKKTAQEKHENKIASKQQNVAASKSSSSKSGENEVNDTQAPIISMTCSQDYEPIQCAQRLSDVSAFENETQRKTSEFLIPPTPIATRNSLIPSSINSFFGDSEVIFVPPSSASIGGKTSSTKTNKKTENFIILSGSDNESSSSLKASTTSRRTRALKPKRNQNTTSEEANCKVPTFSQLLAKHSTRTSAKSPDLFSNCSDLAQLPCSQTPANVEETNAPFEGFKIFGSEVKQLQQHYALSKTQIPNSNGKKSFRDRSCLDILENMFEPANKKQKSKGSAKSKGNEALDDPTPNTTTHTQPSKRIATQKSKVQGPIVPHHPIEAIAEAKAQMEKKTRSLASSVNEDEIFEITNNGTFGSVMRLHSNGDVSPVHQTQKSSTQHNKITKYFQGGLSQNLIGSQEDNGNNSEAGTPSKKQQQTTSTQYAHLKRSPKQKGTPTQITKLTKWFTKNTPTKQIQTQVSKSNSSPPAKCKQSAGKRTVKRRRLDLTHIRSDSE